MAQPDFWNDNEQAQKVIAENNILKEKRDTFVNLRDQISDLKRRLNYCGWADDDLQKISKHHLQIHKGFRTVSQRNFLMGI